jgi:hypothetical protein
MRTKRKRGQRPAPAGYLTVEAWGKQIGRGRSAAYAAVRRGEVPSETIGGMKVIRADWREQLQRRAEADALERRRQHAAGLRRNRAAQEKVVDT